MSVHDSGVPGMCYPCPLDCGWHHDVPDDSYNGNYPCPPLPENPSQADITGSLFIGRVVQTEHVLRQHFETHPLTEWVTALVTARNERDQLAVELQTERAQAQAIRNWMRTVDGVGAAIRQE